MKPSKMKPKERVLAALYGEWSDLVPFTVYSNKIFTCQVERELRNDGLCIVENYIQPHIAISPNVKEKTIYCKAEDGITRSRRILETPKGTLTELHKRLPDHPRIPGELYPWTEEYLFKGPNDYAALEFMVRDQVYLPNYQVVQEMQESAGEDTVIIPWTMFSPLNEILITYMGIEIFSIEWHVRRDRIMELYEALIENRRKFYEIAAKSPLVAINYCGNVSPEVLGLERFREYCIPHYNEFADILHENGKQLLVHFDANNRPFLEAIAKSRIDVIEAFTPYPNSDMTVSDARKAWPDKILWINFPSASILDTSENIEAITRNILKEAIPGDRFLVGITETVPHPKWQESYSAIMKILKNEGKLPLSR